MLQLGSFCSWKNFWIYVNEEIWYSRDISYYKKALIAHTQKSEPSSLRSWSKWPHWPPGWTRCWCSAHWARNTWDGTSFREAAGCSIAPDGSPARSWTWNPHLGKREVRKTVSKREEHQKGKRRGPPAGRMHRPYMDMPEVELVASRCFPSRTLRCNCRDSCSGFSSSPSTRISQ